MINKIKYFFIGPPLPNEEMSGRQLNKIRALAAFSPDALSSLAYANQEIYLGLVVAGAAGLALSLPIAGAITLLLSIVALSYAQTIRAYPSGGGSYVVARENLGLRAGMVAAAALLVDYILTAAVSLTAGVAEIISAFPQLTPYRVALALAILVLVTLLNLRGLQESGTAMSLPVYLFLFAFFAMLLAGAVKLLSGAPVSAAAAAIPLATQPLTLVLVLHAFSAGCTALTGIEAISNGVPVFKAPQVRNAQKTLAAMALLMGLLFLGSIALTQVLHVSAGPNETILSALGRAVLGTGWLYYLVQFSTLGILAVAANTSFAGFPRIAAILSADGFLPRQLANLGDRLVYKNGIVLLALMSGLLIVVFGGNSHALVPLFAVGAFSAFTLSQAGMVRHWLRTREPGWQLKAAINGLGASVTGLTLVVIGVSKFAEGAWISILVVGLLLALFSYIHSHYQDVAAQLSLRGLPPSLRPAPRPRVIIPVSSVHRGMIDAVNFARSISDQVTALYIHADALVTDEEGVRKRWQAWFPDVRLEIRPSPYRSLVEPLIRFLDEEDQRCNDGTQAVLVLPELIPAHPWQEVLHNQSAESIKRALLYQRRKHGFQRVIIDVPYHLREPAHPHPTHDYKKHA